MILPTGGGLPNRRGGPAPYPDPEAEGNKTLAAERLAGHQLSLFSQIKNTIRSVPSEMETC